MDRSDTPESFQIIHIHNYSIIAIQSLISEIKKFPIIYKKNKRISLARELTDLAWGRILSSALEWGGTFDNPERAYWELSFREVWKWMYSTLMQDMKARLGNPVHIRNPNYNWFLSHLKFLEKHICLEQEAVETEESDPNIHVKVISPDTDDQETKNHTVIWVRDSKESTLNEDEGISICFRTTVNACKELSMKLISTNSPDSQASDEEVIDVSSNLEPMPVCIPSPSASFSIEDPIPSCIPSSSGIFFEENPMPSGFQSSLASSTQEKEIPAPIPKEDEPVVPRPKNFQLTIDEDFQFIMSLLPKLKNLEPKTNTEVKMLIMQALYDSF